MSLYKYYEKVPKLGDGCYISEGARVIGDVELGDNVSIWFNSVVRGDMAKITIGNGTNVQDLSMLHVDNGAPLKIGNEVTIGHNAILHGCTIGDNSLIGMGAQVLDNAIIGKNSLVAAGAVVPPGKTYPDNSLIMGAPAKVKRVLTLEEMKIYGNQFKVYLKEKGNYLNSEIVQKIK